MFSNKSSHEFEFKVEFGFKKESQDSSSDTPALIFINNFVFLLLLPAAFVRNLVSQELDLVPELVFSS